MNELTEKRTPEIIGAEIRALSVQCNTMRVQYAIEIGRRLCEAKELCKHGEWLDFLKRETAYSQPKASRLMQVYREYAADQIGIEGAELKYSTLNNLSISNALKLLDIPEEERESFALEHDAEHLSARELEALVRDRTAELAAQKEESDRKAEAERSARELSEQERKKLEETLAKMRDELREIEARPQTVAVERDEEAITEAVEAARREADQKIAQAANDAADAERAKHIEAEKQLKQKIADLDSKLKQADATKANAEQQLAALKEKAEAAEKSGAEAEQLRGQIKTLEGRLAVASPEVAEFKAAFDRAQKELTAMLEALEKVQDAELRAKLSTAAKTVLGSFAGRIEG